MDGAAGFFIDGLSCLWCAHVTNVLTSVCAKEWCHLAYYNYEEEIAPLFEQATVLGEGAFGKVLRCTLRNVDVAVKAEVGTGVPSAHGIESFLQQVNFYMQSFYHAWQIFHCTRMSIGCFAKRIKTFGCMFLWSAAKTARLLQPGWERLGAQILLCTSTIWSCTCTDGRFKARCVSIECI